MFARIRRGTHTTITALTPVGHVLILTLLGGCVGLLVGIFGMAALIPGGHWVAGGGDAAGAFEALCICTGIVTGIAGGAVGGVLGVQVIQEQRRDSCLPAPAFIVRSADAQTTHAFNAGWLFLRFAMCIVILLLMVLVTSFARE